MCIALVERIAFLGNPVAWHILVQDPFTMALSLCRTILDFCPAVSDMVHPFSVVLQTCMGRQKAVVYEPGDDSNHANCQWCGRPHTSAVLVCCDSCPCAFCQDCIQLNVGLAGLQRILTSQSWRCFVCRPQTIRILQQWCALFVVPSESKFGKRLHKARGSTSDSCADLEPAKKTPEETTTSTQSPGEARRSGE